MSTETLERIGRELTRKHLLDTDSLEKARGHKYFKREMKGGKWKYYYTEAEYKKEKGKKGAFGVDKKPDRKRSPYAVALEVMTKEQKVALASKDKKEKESWLIPNKQMSESQRGVYSSSELNTMIEETLPIGRSQTYEEHVKKLSGKKRKKKGKAPIWTADVNTDKAEDRKTLNDFVKKNKGKKAFGAFKVGEKVEVTHEDGAYNATVVANTGKDYALVRDTNGDFDEVTHFQITKK